MRTYRYSTTLNWADEEIEVEVSYTVTWGSPETGPSYGCGGTPADPDEINDLKLISWGPEAVTSLLDWNDRDDILDAVLEERFDQMIENAADENASDYEHVLEQRAERQREPD